MTNNKDYEDGLLDGAGKSRRFVEPYKKEDLLEEKRRRNLQKRQDKKSSRIDNKIKYGNYKKEATNRDELSIAEQIRIAAGFKQAIIKVTSYGKGVNKVFNHIAYITRNFELPLEDQVQSLVQSREDTTALLEAWESIYFDGRKNARDTVHIVFSAPPATCRNTFKQLTREFLSDEFEGEHDYLFVAHNDTEHPHIHSVICLQSTEGKKLNPRKEYLRQLRKRFAEKCREHGIMLDASRRFERGLSGKSAKSEFVQMRDKRQVVPDADKQLIERVKNEINTNHSSVDTGEALRKARNSKIKNHFYNTAKTLYETFMATSEDKRQDKDMKAAKLLLDYSKKFPNEMTRADYLKEQLQNNLSPSLSKTSDFLGLGGLVDNQQSKFKQPDLELGDD